MAKKIARKRRTLQTKKSKPEAPTKEFPTISENPYVHLYGSGHVCATAQRGFKTPKNQSPTSIVLDRSEGFIPLWGEHVTLHWRFNEASFQFTGGAAKKTEVRNLIAQAIEAWGDAAPVNFKETNDVWDFEFVMQPSDSCSPFGCTLARAFFPDAGRHDIAIYPQMFTQSHDEQIETLVHEFGHVFGLRHFFADVEETSFPSVVFGTHSKFSIMNYGANSTLTENDKSDLKTLYALVWGGAINQIKGTPIVQMRPYHEFGLASSLMAAPRVATVAATQPNCALTQLLHTLSVGGGPR